MDSRDAAKPWGDAPPSFAPPRAAVVVPLRSTAVSAIAWAGVASTLHRIQRGEGALLAVNLSLVAARWQDPASAIANVVVSVLTIALMYALNDLYDAPTDANNPKKDRALIATYLDHRAACAGAIAVAKVCTIGLAYVALGAQAAAAVVAAMIVNLVYSFWLKGVPVVDVVWCGVWGAAYAAIVSSSPWVWAMVGLMTAVCHLYQALDDRLADAANAITTTAVRSPGLSTAVLVALSILLFGVLRLPLGNAGALSAFTPLAIYFISGSARTGWLLTKLYFGVVWLYLLGVAGAAG